LVGAFVRGVFSDLRYVGLELSRARLARELSRSTVGAGSASSAAGLGGFALVVVAGLFRFGGAFVAVHGHSRLDGIVKHVSTCPALNWLLRAITAKRS
jgi:hypothetical protein